MVIIDKVNLMSKLMLVLIIPAVLVKVLNMELL